MEPDSTPTPDSDETDQPRWPADPKSKMRRLEAVLFMSRGPLPTRKLSQLADLEDGTQARTMIKQLNKHYDDVGRAFHVKPVAGGYQLRTRPQFADWIGLLEHVPRAKRLSSPALETLTVVAYRQPVIKAEIEAIRGVSSGEMLRQLLELGLVKIAGRSEKLGRPFLYATSKEFLTYFGLNTLKELPRSKQLSGQGLPEWASSDQNRDPSENKMNTIEIRPLETDVSETDPQETQTNGKSNRDLPKKEEEE